MSHNIGDIICPACGERIPPEVKTNTAGDEVYRYTCAAGNDFTSEWKKCN